MTSTNDLTSVRERLAARAKLANPQGESLIARKLRERREAQEAAAASSKPVPAEVLQADRPAGLNELQDDPGPTTRAPAVLGFEDTSAPAPEPSEHVEPVADPQPAAPEPVADEPKPRKRRPGRPKGSKNKKTDTTADAKADKVIDAVIAEKKSEQSVVEPDPINHLVGRALLRTTPTFDHGDVLVRLHVAAIAAHQGPEMANAHYRSILEQIEGER